MGSSLSSIQAIIYDRNFPRFPRPDKLPWQPHPGYRTCTAVMCKEILVDNIEFGNKKRLLSGMRGQFMVCFNVSAWPDV